MQAVNEDIAAMNTLHSFNTGRRGRVFEVFLGGEYTLILLVNLLFFTFMIK